MDLPTTGQHGGGLAPKRDSAARRSRLREFQAQLLERMQIAKSGSGARSNQLGVQVGAGRWLLDLREVSEILSVGVVSPVPLTHDWYLGLANVRGNLLSVIDFARFMGQPPTKIDKECRIIAFSPTLSFNSGLLVSRVMGLRNLAEMAPQPGAAVDGQAWRAGAFLDGDSQAWAGLSLTQMVQDDRFLHVGI